MNKKKILWVVMIIVAIAVIASLSYVFTRPSEDNPSTTTTTGGYANLAKAVTVSYGSDLKGQVNLQYSIEMGLLKEGVLQMHITLENTSQDTIARAVAVMQVLDEKGGVIRDDFAIFLNVKPGATNKATFGFVNLTVFSEAERIVLIVNRTGNTITTTTTTATTTSVSGSPGKVVVAFFDAMRDGRYTEAKNCLSSQNLIDYLKYLNEYNHTTYASLEEALRAVPKSEIPQKVTILSEEQENPTKVRVRISAVFQTGTENLSYVVVKETGGWKLYLS